MMQSRATRDIYTSNSSPLFCSVSIRLFYFYCHLFNLPSTSYARLRIYIRQRPFRQHVVGGLSLRCAPLLRKLLVPCAKNNRTNKDAFRKTVRLRVLFGWMVGDGGQTVFMKRCSSRFMKGLVDFSLAGDLLAAVRAQAACSITLVRARRFVVVGHGTIVRLVRRRALAGSPFVILAATLGKALLSGGHPDRLVADEGRYLQEQLGSIVHLSASLAEARLFVGHIEREVRAVKARPAGGCASGSTLPTPQASRRSHRRGTQYGRHAGTAPEGCLDGGGRPGASTMKIADAQTSPSRETS